MPDVVPSALHDAVASQNTEKALQLILQLKEHIKHEQVNINYAPKYFDSLLVGFKEPRLMISSFSTTCHLIKRIRLQDPNTLKGVTSSVVPFLFERLKEEKASMRNAAMKAIVTVWEAIPAQFEDSLRKRGLRNSDSAIRNGLLGMVIEIAQNSPGFTLRAILPDVVSMLADSNEEVAQKADALLVLFYNDIAPGDSQARSDLVRQLSNSPRVGHNLAMRLLSRIHKGNELLSQYKQKTSRYGPGYGPNSRSASGSGATNFRPTSQQRRPASSRTENSGPIVSKSEKIEAILAATPAYYTVDRIEPINFLDESQMIDRLGPLEITFEGKETEQNWIKRERAIQLLRGVLRGNAVSEYSVALGEFVRGFKHCVTKAVLSLRTTLSSNACQLCKDLGEMAGSLLDSLTTDALLGALSKLVSNRKTISHQRSNAAFIALLLHAPYTSRFIHYIQQASQDKNVQPRVYAGTWMELFMLKHGQRDSLQDIQERIDSIIAKGIVDPMPSVRETMRSAYWVLNDVCPSSADRMMRRLSPALTRALERAKYNQPKPIARPASRPASRPVSRQISRSASNHATPRPLPEELKKENMPLEQQQQQQQSPRPAVKPRLTSHTLLEARPVQQTVEPVESVPSSDCKPNDTIDSTEGYTEKFNKENALYEQVTSDDAKIQAEGVKNLVLHMPERLPLKFNSALNELSIKNVYALLPMFESEDIFNYVSSYLTSDNVVRVGCFLPIANKQKFTAAETKMLLHNIPMNEFCSGLANTMQYCVDSSHIRDINLSMQFIKHKWELITSSFELTEALLRDSTLHTENYLWSTIFDALLKCWEFTDEAEDRYLALLNLCAEMHGDVFEKSFNSSADEVTKKELGSRLGLHSGVSSQSETMDLKYLPTATDLNDFGSNLDGLTMVVRKHVKKPAPEQKKFETDMTMIMPKFSKRPEPRPVVAEEEHVPGQEPEQEPEENPFVETKSDSMDVDTSKEDSDATPDLAQLTINPKGDQGVPLAPAEPGESEESPESEESEEFETLVESIDPLAPLTNNTSTTKFSIYEDNISNKSLEQLNTWYDFTGFRYKYICEQTGAELEGLKKKLEQGKISHDELSFLAHALEDGEEEVNCSELLPHLLGYMRVDTAHDCLYAGLMLMRICVNQNKEGQQKCFEKLIELCGSVEEPDELYFAIQETMQTTFPEVSFYVSALQQKSLTGVQKMVLMETLYALISPESVSYEDVFMLDLILYRLIKEDETGVRKMAVMIYAKFMQFKEEGVKSSGGAELIDEGLFGKLDAVQSELVHHYAATIGST